jgi:hypothetical protein
MLPYFQLFMPPTNNYRTNSKLNYWHSFIKAESTPTLAIFTLIYVRTGKKTTSTDDQHHTMARPPNAVAEIRIH